MSRQLQRRTPRKNSGFSWGRFPSGPTVTYRVFLRDSTGALHMRQTTCYPGMETPRFIAQSIRAEKAQLRWQVDQLEFARLGLQDTAPRPEVRA